MKLVNCIVLQKVRKNSNPNQFSFCSDKSIKFQSYCAWNIIKTKKIKNIFLNSLQWTNSIVSFGNWISNSYLSTYSWWWLSELEIIYGELFLIVVLHWILNLLNPLNNFGSRLPVYEKHYRRFELKILKQLSSHICICRSWSPNNKSI